MFPYPILVCDIGGTNARFASSCSAVEPLNVLAPARSAQFADFMDACRFAIASIGYKPASLIISAAGPVKGRSVDLTNISWRIDGVTAAHELGLQQGLLLNDFEAQALSLPVLTEGDLRPIGKRDKRHPDGPQVVLGPGTGLGVAALLSFGKQHLALASEAGHMELAMPSSDDAHMFKFAQNNERRLAAETLISGPGLARLHQARLKAAGHQKFVSADPALICNQALQNRTGEEADSIRHFWQLVARFAGDMALAFIARGGVILAGGVLPNLLPFLDDNAFRADFEHKAPMQDLLKKISVSVLINDKAVLHGMRAIADAPNKYALDYESRCWT